MSEIMVVTYAEEKIIKFMHFKSLLNKINIVKLYKKVVNYIKFKITTKFNAA